MLDYGAAATRLRKRVAHYSAQLHGTPGGGSREEWALAKQMDSAVQLLESVQIRATVERMRNREYVYLRDLYMTGKGWTLGPTKKDAFCFVCRLPLNPGEGERYEYEDAMGGKFTVPLCILHDVRHRHCRRCGWPVIEGTCASCGLIYQDHKKEPKGVPNGKLTRLSST